MTAGAGPYGIQLSRAIRLFVECVLLVIPLDLVVPSYKLIN